MKNEFETTVYLDLQVVDNTLVLTKDKQSLKFNLSKEEAQKLEGKSVSGSLDICGQKSDEGFTNVEIDLEVSSEDSVILEKPLEVEHTQAKDSVLGNWISNEI